MDPWLHEHGLKKSEQNRNYRRGVECETRVGKPVAGPGTGKLSLPLEIGKGHVASAFCSVGNKDAPQSRYEQRSTQTVFLRQMSVLNSANK